MSSVRKIEVKGPGPWGFKIQGGSEFRTPIIITEVNANSKSYGSGVRANQYILDVHNSSTASLSLDETKKLLTSNKEWLRMTVSEEPPAKRIPDVSLSESFNTAAKVEQPKDSFSASKTTSCGVDYSKPIKHSDKPGASAVNGGASHSQSAATSTSKFQASEKNSEENAAGLRSSSQPVVGSYLNRLLKQTESEAEPMTSVKDENKCASSPSWIKPAGESPEAHSQESYKKISSISKSPVCRTCYQLITGSGFVRIGGDPYHYEHVTCKNCNKDLRKEQILSDDDGRLICSDCFTNKNCLPCSVCSKKILTTMIKAGGKQFHEECFKCGSCKKQITEGFTMEGTLPKCTNCTDTNKICCVCQNKILTQDAYLQVGYSNYHQKCFKCAVCHNLIESGKNYYMSRIKKKICCSDACAMKQ